MVLRGWRAALTSVLCIAALACGGGAPGTLVSIPPPASWQAQLQRARAEKDAEFRDSPDTPLLEEDRASFSGLAYWPPDPRYYFVGPLHAYAVPERFDIVSTAGTRRPCERVGWIGFTLDGKPQRLQVYRLLDGPGGWFLPFTDGTSGQETYPAGRYVELVGPAQGPFVLDFNTAYNPSCAYGAPERFECPVTPRENRLSVRIEAGEKGFKPGAVLPEADP